MPTGRREEEEEKEKKKEQKMEEARFGWQQGRDGEFRVGCALFFFFFFFDKNGAKSQEPHRRVRGG